MKYTSQAVMKIWTMLIEYVENNKIIDGVEFSKKWKVLKMNHGELVPCFFSKNDALCADKMTKFQKEVPEEDISALVIASLPQDLLDCIM